MSSMTGSGELARANEKNADNASVIKPKFEPKALEGFEEKENGDLIHRLKEKAKSFGY